MSTLNIYVITCNKPHSLLMKMICNVEETSVFKEKLCLPYNHGDFKPMVETIADNIIECINQSNISSSDNVNVRFILSGHTLNTFENIIDYVFKKTNILVEIAVNPSHTVVMYPDLQADLTFKLIKGYTTEKTKQQCEYYDIKKHSIDGAKDAVKQKKRNEYMQSILNNKKQLIDEYSSISTDPSFKKTEINKLEMYIKEIETHLREQYILLEQLKNENKQENEDLLDLLNRKN